MEKDILKELQQIRKLLEKMEIKQTKSDNRREVVEKEVKEIKDLLKKR